MSHREKQALIDELTAREGDVRRSIDNNRDDVKKCDEGRLPSVFGENVGNCHRTSGEELRMEPIARGVPKAVCAGSC